MECITFDDITIPVLGLGTWGFGGEYGRSESKDEKDIESIRNAIDLGFTHIDGAEMYGHGHTEELIGRAIRGRYREKLFITSKVWKDDLSYDNVICACEKSLKRVGTDYFDLYLVHAWNKDYPLKKTMEAMDVLVEEKLVKHIGVSNFFTSSLKEAQSYSRNKIVTNQVDYSLLVRDAEKELLPYCQAQDIILTAYTPLSRGKLATPGFKVLDEIAKKYGKTQAQIAINWLISHKNVITIPKSGNIEHLKENLGGIGWRMDRLDIERLNKEKEWERE